jgi:hypothetical protein
LELPESQEYLQQELENIIKALASIEAEIHLNGRFEIAPAKLRELNRSVLADLEVEDHVTPGEFRTVPIGVGTVYRGAPPEDCSVVLGQPRL